MHQAAVTAGTEYVKSDASLHELADHCHMRYVTCQI